MTSFPLELCTLQSGVVKLQSNSWHFLERSRIFPLQAFLFLNPSDNSSKTLKYANWLPENENKWPPKVLPSLSVQRCFIYIPINFPISIFISQQGCESYNPFVKGLKLNWFLQHGGLLEGPFAIFLEAPALLTGWLSSTRVCSMELSELQMQKFPLTLWAVCW